MRTSPTWQPLKISEKQLQKHAEDILQLDGWRVFRPEQNFSERKRKVVGEAGAPDGLYVRYGGFFHDGSDAADFMSECAAEVMWIEWKSAKGRPSTAQKIWHAAERKRGALALIAGEDFPATIDGFKEWYKNSGLMRKSF